MAGHLFLSLLSSFFLRLLPVPIVVTAIMHHWSFGLVIGIGNHRLLQHAAEYSKEWGWTMIHFRIDTSLYYFECPKSSSMIDEYGCPVNDRWATVRLLKNICIENRAPLRNVASDHKYCYIVNGKLLSVTRRVSWESFSMSIIRRRSCKCTRITSPDSSCAWLFMLYSFVRCP